MKKIIPLLLLILIIAVSCNNDVSLEGEGTEKNPYLISNKEDLLNFKVMVERGELFEKFASLTNNIDLNGMEWEPIGYKNCCFNGYLNGNNFTIFNLKITNNYKTIGFFSNVYNDDVNKIVINNLNIKDFKIELFNINIEAIGLLATYNTGSISNCNIEGDINLDNVSFNNIGGIVANSIGNIDNSNSNVNMNIKLSEFNENESYQWGNIGGVGGYINGNIVNCNYNGEMNITHNRRELLTYKTNYHTGGIVGNIDGDLSKISNCVNNGFLTTVGATGGILGTSGSSIIVEKCINKNNIYVKGENLADTGGIISRIYNGRSKIDSCVNLGNIIVETLDDPNNTESAAIYISAFIGGLLGCGKVGIYNSYNEGNISVSGSNIHYVGGLAGGLDDSLISSYNLGNIHAVSSKNTVMAGGLVGVIQTTVENIIIKNNYNYSTLEIKSGTGGNIFINELVGFLWGYNMTDASTVHSNYFVKLEPNNKDSKLIYPIYAYGEETEAENISSPTIYDNLEISYDELISGERLKFFIKNDKWIFEENKLPKINIK